MCACVCVCMRKRVDSVIFTRSEIEFSNPFRRHVGTAVKEVLLTTRWGQCNLNNSTNMRSDDIVGTRKLLQFMLRVSLDLSSSSKTI